MQGDAKVVAQLGRFEPVEWWYDGLNGKIIPWTLENGGTSHDPSILAFVLDLEGRVIAKCETAKAYQADAFADWLKAQADAWETTHPRTAVAFVPAEVAAEGEGTDRRVVCAALDAAREARRPVAVYVGRDAVDGADRAARKESDAARKFEKKTLDSRKAADEAEGWVLLRLDRAQPDHAHLAAALGVEEAPAVVLLVPAEPEPVLLDGRTSSSRLAYHLKKYRSAVPTDE